MGSQGSGMTEWLTGSVLIVSHVPLTLGCQLSAFLGALSAGSRLSMYLCVYQLVHHREAFKTALLVSLRLVNAIWGYVRLFVTGWKTLLKRNWWVNYYQLEERSPKAALRTCVWFSGSCIESLSASYEQSSHLYYNLIHKSPAYRLSVW